MINTTNFLVEDTLMGTRSISPADLAKSQDNQNVADNQIEIKATPTIQRSVPLEQPSPAVTLMNPVQNEKTLTIQQVLELGEQFIRVREGSKTVQLVRGRESTYAERSIKALSKLLAFVWNHQGEVHVIDAFRKFMVKHRGKHLACENALQGINLITSEMERGRYSIMYMLMYELTNPDRLRNDYDFSHAEKVCRNDNCNPPNGYIQFISSRLR